VPPYLARYRVFSASYSSERQT